MKNRILTFIIGLLVGAIITTIGFLIYSKTMNKRMDFDKRIPFEGREEMEWLNREMGTPPEKPQGNFRPEM